MQPFLNPAREPENTAGSFSLQVIQELQADPLLLAAIIESSEDAILSKAPDGTITSWNPAAERLYGWSVEEVLGRHISLLIPAERGEELAGIMDRLRRGERMEHYETVRQRKDGTRVEVSVSISPIKDSSGSLIGASVIARDMTARKRLENDLRRQASQLAEADHRKDEFLAVLAHELRNPLAPIRNAVQVMRLLDSAEPELQWSQGLIERQVQQLSRLVDDLLDVSRITRGKIQLRDEVLDLAAVVQRAVETSRPLIEEHRHTLTVSLASQPLRLKGDGARLAQVISNLLNNAAKYTHEGGQIWLTLERQGGQALIRVQDTGLGIPADMLPRIFDLFTQVDRSLDQSQGGLGIGLTLVRSLVEMHGGTVEAYSDGPGQGSEFVVRLPALPAEPARDHSEIQGPEPRQGQGRCLRVLVVDDSRDTTDSLAMLLRMWGHDVRIAHDGPAALEAARTYRPGVILLDIGVPGLSGLEVAQQLRQDPNFTHTLLVAMTGYGQEEDRRRSQAAGFDLHWVKPVDPDTLKDLLSSPNVANPETPPST